MWISNTATTAMMVPIAHAVLESLKEGKAADEEMGQEEGDDDDDEEEEEDEGREMGEPQPYGTKPGHFETSKIHFPTSERCERTSERTSDSPSTYVPILGCSAPLCSHRTSCHCELTVK